MMTNVVGACDAMKIGRNLSDMLAAHNLNVKRGEKPAQGTHAPLSTSGDGTSEPYLLQAKDLVLLVVYLESSVHC